MSMQSFIWRSLCVFALFVTIPAAAPAQDAARAEAPARGLRSGTDDATVGYSLYTPLQSTTTYLLDMKGNVVHTWTSEYNPGNSVYLLPGGNLLRTARDSAGGVFRGGGIGGRIQELDWQSNVVWDHAFNGTEHMQHHDIEPLPNGNILVIAWEARSADEAIAAGRDPESVGENGFWPDKIVEIRPIRPDRAEVVWEWRVFDHLIQDRDPQKPNHGDPAQHPERVDINFDLPRNEITTVDDMTAKERLRLEALGYIETPAKKPDEDTADRRDERNGSKRTDWLHTNSIAYDAELDQILLSVRVANEIWIIDHSTTTAEAAGSKGGRHGKGGDLLYRWGNPWNSHLGPASARQLFGQHDATWIDRGNGKRSVLIFNNGRGRTDGDYSTVDEIVLPIRADGSYERVDGKPFGPEKPEWTYRAEGFYANFISGAHRLPGGNTMICDGPQGRFFEVTRDGKVVWDYWNPVVSAPKRDERPGGPDARGRGDDWRPARGDERPGAEGRVRGERPGGEGRGRGEVRGGEGRRGERPGGEGRGRGGRGGGGREMTYAAFRVTRIAPDHPGLAGKELPPPMPPARRGI